MRIEMNLRPTEDTVESEFRRVKEAEREKAREKYGEEGLAPGGRREFDILDYLINEVVGLDRYGEMVKHRFPDNPELIMLASDLQYVARTHGRGLIRQRLTLIASKQELGFVERRVKSDGN